MAEGGDHGQEAAHCTAALRQSADILNLLLQVGLVVRQAAGDLGELHRHEHGQQAGDDKGAQHDGRHGERQRQETAYPRHGGTQDEGEEHGDRHRDQHLAPEIERHDHGRADECYGGGAHEARLAPGRSRKIEEFHGRRPACWQLWHLNGFIAAPPGPADAQTERTLRRTTGG